ncbi:DHH family phosphoesterase [Pelagicoccus sp. SDUM812003]|uniref:DHH family phosphoesterase n=1 Tax=Pelagicoccus sp. SDUM812003 TaxID=3041267 RepID=UPI00280DDCB1|nr:DHH family phosphoesterase [Pelagicoccus sp. SDUM812003]MDQ8204972.1 DHH family phosphoesterase [Pelagicoccus sp. SDUM812003]
MSYFPHLAETFSELLASIANDRVLILGHARPDGDCVGSQIALTRLLRQQGVDAVPLNAYPVPKALSFLDENEPIGLLRPESLDGSPMIFVDCADENRVGNEASQWIRDANFLGNIDHHISNTEFARMNIVDATTAATCEILAGLAFDFGWDIDDCAAQALLTGIMTDTGRFGYAATSSRVFDLSARLVERGARPHITTQSLYENEPFSRLKLLQHFLASLRTEFEGKLGIGKLLREDFLDTEADYEQTEGFVDYTRSIRGAKVGLYLEQRKRTVKASLRAENADYRVDQVARQFGGGGHACAAAFSTDLSLEEVEPLVVQAIVKRIKEVELSET